VLNFRPAKEDWKRSSDSFNRNGGTGFAWEVLLCVVSLLAIGAVMVYSATTMFADNARYNVEAGFFFWKHLKSMLIAGVACWVVYRIPMRLWYRWAPWIFGFALLLLVAVLIPGVGKVVNGSRRWIGLGIMNLQVSEVMKVAALIMAAWYTVKRQDYMHSFQMGFFPIAFLMVGVVGLLMWQPDLGATAVIAAEILGVRLFGRTENENFQFCQRSGPRLCDVDDLPDSLAPVAFSVVSGSLGSGICPRYRLPAFSFADCFRPRGNFRRGIGGFR